MDLKAELNELSGWVGKWTKTTDAMAEAAAQACVNTFARRMAIKNGGHGMPKRRWRRQRHRFTHHAILMEECHKAWRRVKALGTSPTAGDAEGGR